ncbi:hypothetical protein E2562_003704 [Oryza meyeriana var. granulata]|uniref:Uncharacterized protein n=1 Tax=Oryza meyeriana var. granulata TaxID=110450 RepID=A0A6G1C3Q7_9ORYZ|nr:hypothetical protein E2562_003704 [Oryza meyeriana var. granulata]
MEVVVIRHASLSQLQIRRPKWRSGVLRNDELDSGVAHGGGDPDSGVASLAKATSMVDWCAWEGPLKGVAGQHASLTQLPMSGSVRQGPFPCEGTVPC